MESIAEIPIGGIVGHIFKRISERPETVFELRSKTTEPAPPVTAISENCEYAPDMKTQIPVNSRFANTVEDRAIVLRVVQARGFSPSFETFEEDRLIPSSFNRSFLTIRTTAAGSHGNSPLELNVRWDLVTSLENHLAAALGLPQPLFGR